MFVFLLVVVAVFSVMVFLQFISTYCDTIEIYGNSKYGDRRLKRAQIYQQLSEQFGAGFEESVRDKVRQIGKIEAGARKNRKLAGKKQKTRIKGLREKETGSRAEKNAEKNRKRQACGREIAAYKVIPKEKDRNGNCKAKRKDSSHAGYSAANGVRRKGMYKHNGKGKFRDSCPVFKKKS